MTADRALPAQEPREPRLPIFPVVVAAAEGGVDYGPFDTGLRVAQTIFLDVARRLAPGAIERASFSAGVQLGLLIPDTERAAWRDWFASWSPPGHYFGAMLAALSDAAESDGHPEDTCERCGGRNIVWHAPSPVWNAVMRSVDGADAWSIVCPLCFAELAAAKGIGTVWCLRPEPMPDVPMVDADGRVWDADQCLWVTVSAAAPRDAGAGLDAAWKALEDALPEGREWTVSIRHAAGGYEADVELDDDDPGSAHHPFVGPLLDEPRVGPTPAAALNALAAALQTPGAPGSGDGATE